MNRIIPKILIRDLHISEFDAFLFSGEGNGTILFYTAEKFIIVGDKKNRPERLKHTD